MRIDNTQYSAFTKCPLYWYEKYVNKTHRPVVGQRDDALAIGVHVHSALENGYTNNKFRVDASTSDEYPLTREAALEVATMVEMYRKNYPGGPVEFPFNGLETPLEWTIYESATTLVAKVDGYFTITSPCEISDGMGGSIHMEPGVYSLETKTKASGLNRGVYLKEWNAAMQATFQLLTLREYVATIGLTAPANVRGVLVNVIERPKIYTPRKTCKGCKELLPMYTYTVEPGGTYRCNNCNHSNQFPGPFPEPRVDPPSTWRFLVERSDERLAMDLANIQQVAVLMESSTVWANRNECVRAYGNKPCEYFEPHNAESPVTAVDYPDFVIFNPTKYLEPKELV